MLKKFIISLILIITIMSAAILFIPTSTHEPLTENSEQTKISSKKSQYCVRALNGKIAVYINDEDSPLYVLPSPLIEDLPQYDRELLTRGIVVNSNEALLRVLEDYDN